MKRINNGWRPMEIYCSNCSQKLIGYMNDEGVTKYECPRCRCSLVSKQKGRRHTQIDVFAPPEHIAVY